LAKVTAAAKAELPNATIVRVETDADRHAAYEAHVVKADGTPATVYVDKQFNVVSVKTAEDRDEDGAAPARPRLSSDQRPCPSFSFP
jgi:hypothetical protein